ncbi:MAG: ferric reductase-like transmembrane domain-containing protein [Acidimicrobiia bacterium]|jgi:predicted ferric reductase
MGTQIWWESARAAGIVAWALATLAVVGGLQLSTRLVRKPAPAWVLDVHRFVGGLAVVFTGVHILGLLLDTYTSFGPVEVLVPFTSSYKPAAVALGVVAFYLILAIELTSLAMRKLGRKVWHGVHLSSYLLFVVATVHGITAGTDRHNVWFQWACVLAAALVLFMTLVRILAPRRGSDRPPRDRAAPDPTPTG